LRVVAGLENEQAQGVARGLVRVQDNVMDAHAVLRPANQLMEQRGQIAVGDDHFRNGLQGLVPLASGSYRSVKVSACHGENPGPSLLRNLQVIHRTAGYSKSPA
jgi:hypothetical protein